MHLIDFAAEEKILADFRKCPLFLLNITDRYNCIYNSRDLRI